MRLRVLVAIGAVIAAVTLIAAAGATTGSSVPRVDLSTNQAVVAYLTSLGIDPTGVVIQRGALNYAGPGCPGAAWNCTTATKVVQVAQAGGQNQVACGAGANVIPDSYMTATLTQDQVNQLVAASSLALPVSTCVAVQAGGAQTNTFRCVRRESPEPVAVQPCEVSQPQVGDNTEASNRAFVLEMMDQNMGPAQDGTQTSNIRQAALGRASNFAHVIQYIKQSTKLGAAQSQEGHQVSCTVQLSEDGAEFSQMIQSLAQKEQSDAATPAQNQNVAVRTKTCDDAGFPAVLTSNANTFARLRQTSFTGRLDSHVNQSHNLDARAPKATGGTQTQGAPPPDGGVQGKVFQDSAGLAKSFGVQNEDQNLSGNSPTITQKQFGPLTCCSTQTGNPGDDVSISEMSAQRAVVNMPVSTLLAAVPNPNALQETLLQGNFETSGDGQIKHRASQNGGSDTASCPPGEIATEDGGTTCSLTTFGVNGVFFAEFPPPCDYPQVFNPETGQCEDVFED
jgi:hypothetical protein